MIDIVTQSHKVFGMASKLTTSEMAAIGDRLRQAREGAGLTIDEAACRLGFVTKGALSKLENGGSPYQTGFPTWVIIGAAKLYDVSADWLMGLTTQIVKPDPVTANIRGIVGAIADTMGMHLTKIENGLLAEIGRLNARLDETDKAFRHWSLATSELLDAIENGEEISDHAKQVGLARDRARLRLQQFHADLTGWQPTPKYLNTPKAARTFHESRATN